MDNETKLTEALAVLLAEKDPNTQGLMLTQWAVVGYFEPVDSMDEVDGVLSTMGSGNAPMTVGLLRMGEAYMKELSELG